MDKIRLKRAYKNQHPPKWEKHYVSTIVHFHIQETNYKDENYAYKDFPYRWYERTYLYKFLKKCLNIFKIRYAKHRIIRKLAYDILIFVTATIIVTAILKFWLKWI